MYCRFYDQQSFYFCLNHFDLSQINLRSRLRSVFLFLIHNSKRQNVLYFVVCSTEFS